MNINMTREDIVIGLALIMLLFALPTPAHSRNSHVAQQLAGNSGISPLRSDSYLIELILGNHQPHKTRMIRYRRARK